MKYAYLIVSAVAFPLVSVAAGLRSSEAMMIGGRLAMVDFCAEYSDKYAELREKTHSRYKQRVSDIYENLLTDGQVISMKKAMLEEKYNNPGEFVLASLCDATVQNEINIVYQTSLPEYSSPQKTLTLFIKSLQQGDKMAALKCTSESGREKLLQLLGNMDNDQMKEFALQFSNLKMTSKFYNYRKATVSSKGSKETRPVQFHNIRANWLISQL